MLGTYTALLMKHRVLATLGYVKVWGGSSLKLDTSHALHNDVSVTTDLIYDGDRSIIYYII
jgi:hypothetical protein